MSLHSNQAHAAQKSHCAATATSWMLSLPIQINGMGPYLVSVDTGAGVTVILPDVAKELGLEIIATEERRGVGGTISIDMTEACSVTAGGIDVRLDRMGVSSILKRLGGQSLKGNLGYDVLHHGRLIVDFSGNRIAFERTDSTPLLGTPFVIASTKKPLVTVDAMVNGTGPHRFAVDSGAMGTCMAPRLAARLGAAKGTPVQAAGVGGMMDAYFTADPVSLSVGDSCLADVSPVVLDVFDSLAPETGLPLAGIIGRDIMAQYVVTIDYPQSIIRFG